MKTFLLKMRKSQAIIFFKRVLFLLTNPERNEPKFSRNRFKQLTSPPLLNFKESIPLFFQKRRISIVYQVPGML